VSAAISLSDILVFQWITQFNPWRHALVIGNAFGFSTFVIAALSPGCSVDAIDAEVEEVKMAWVLSLPGNRQRLFSRGPTDQGFFSPRFG